MASQTKSGVSADATKVLKTLSASDTPLANKQIASASGLESKTVSDVVKALKTQGLIESPARCKYAVTDQGRKAI